MSRSRTPNSSPPRRAPTIRRAEAGPQPFRDHDQDLVAGGVPQAVVDGLEVVEVDEQGGDRTGRSPIVERGLGGFHESSAIGQSGQRIVERLEAELRLERPALGNIVGQQADQADEPSQDQQRQQGGARGDHEQLAPHARIDDHQDRPGDHGCREADQANGPEPGDGHGIRIGQAAHGGMKGSRSEQDVGRDIQAVKHASTDIRLVERLHGVDLVRNEEAAEARGQHQEGRSPGTRRRHQAQRHTDQDEVSDRVGQGDRKRQGVEVGRGDLRLHHECPRQDRRSRGQDGRVQEPATVTGAEPAPNEEQQAEGDERVAGHVEHVGKGRERVLADRLVPVPQEVTGDEEPLADRHQDPRKPPLGSIAPGPVEDGHDGRAGDHVIQDALRLTADLQEVVGDDAPPRRPRRRRRRATVPVWRNDGMT